MLSFYIASISSLEECLVLNLLHLRVVIWALFSFPKEEFLLYLARAMTVLMLDVEHSIVIQRLKACQIHLETHLSLIPEQILYSANLAQVAVHILPDMLRCDGNRMR